MITLFKNIKELVQVRPEPISFVAGEQMKVYPIPLEAIKLKKCILRGKKCHVIL